jgi:hypothetical protein
MQTRLEKLESSTKKSLEKAELISNLENIINGVEGKVEKIIS